ncbi:GAF domain-containing sensor histidine kinase [Paenibacillus albiflavus]|uniref:GAF domain-containing sensor histidine kinase n=1 Tax=Paenibacillus albiflavus TaxID=2545760 RepID=UPI001F39171E|nr:GAF domain-containing protein [Paenibacillus albiflavus]
MSMMMIQFESSQDNYAEVISLGSQTLELLHVRRSFEPSTLELTLQFCRLRWKLRKHSIESIHNLPPMTNEAYKMAMSVLDHIGNACYFISKKSWVAISFTMIEMTLEYGMTPEASLGFIGYAMFLHYRFQQYEEVYKWGMLACRISKPYPKLYVKTLTSFALCYDSWGQNRSLMLETFTDHAGKVALESGDLWQSNQSVLVNAALLLQFGHPLPDIYDRLIAHSGEFLKHNNTLHWKEAAVFTALLSRLTGYRVTNDPFVTIDVMDEDFVTAVHGDEFQMIDELVCVLHYLPGYLFGQYDEAHEALKKSANILHLRQDAIENPVQMMYESLVMAELYLEASVKEQRAYWTRMEQNLKVLKKHAMRCAENYSHKFLLLKAEMMRLSRKSRLAEQLYERAIETARKYGLIHDVAIIAECYGRYGLHLGKEYVAKFYLQEAYEAYTGWGARAKAIDMEHKYGDILHIRRVSGLERVDALSLVMSTQALSSEVEMKRLINSLMRIMLHNAGAEYGALMFQHERKWVIEAYGTAEELHIQEVPLEEDSAIVPFPIIGYAARTNEEVVLHDAAGVGIFARNSYIRSKALKSVLCMPILYQSKLIGLLYLENKLTPGIFTPERLDVIRLLAAQCAISIENAKLYAGIQHLNNSLEDLVRERTRSLEQAMRETSAALAEVSIYEERNRIAHEIHDIVGDTLASTIQKIEAGKQLLHKDMDEAFIRLQEAQDLVRHSLQEIRGSDHVLKEDKSLDLKQMLMQLIHDTEQNMGVIIHAHIDELPELTNVYKKAIYHALQEGLTNGIKHGDCDEFLFSLKIVQSELCFRLEDRGRGADTIIMGFGLKAMRERAHQLGGSLSIESKFDQGCILTIHLPLSNLKNPD